MDDVAVGDGDSAGWLPFAAAAGSVALSKEILILNEEFLLVFTFSATVYALYKQLGGSVAKFFEERADRIRQWAGVSPRSLSLGSVLRSRPGSCTRHWTRRRS